MKKLTFKPKVFLVYALATIMGISTSAFAATTPVPAGGTKVDSTFKVGNVTQNVNYTGTVNAKTDDVVRYEIWYHNTELANSGKTANNLNIKVSLPTAKTTSHVATAVVGGTNTNVATNNATVNTAIATTLEYIPGTAYRRHNTGTDASPVWVTERISDSVMTASGYTINRMNPCWNFQETITVQARVRASVVSINKQVKIEGTNNAWQAAIDAAPGQTVAYLITIKNEGNTSLTNVMVRDAMPPRMDFVEGSAVLRNSNFPNGTALSDLLIQGGVNVGNYAPGGVGYVRFTAVVPAAVDRCMDNYRFNNAGIVRPEGMGDFSNYAEVIVDYPCVVPPVTPPVTPPVVITGKGNEPLPTSGPAEAAAGAAGVTAIGGVSYAWLRSKKALLSALTKVK